MSAINFNDYTNYDSGFDPGYDFSALMGGTTNSSGNLLSDYAFIKNGSYGKLMKAYYAKADADNASASGETAQKLTLLRSSADSLKKSSEALNNSSLWEKKKITKAVQSFIDDYNSVVEAAGSSDAKNILRNAAWMTGITDKAQNLLSQAGITVGKGNKLELDEKV